MLHFEVYFAVGNANRVWSFKTVVCRDYYQYCLHCSANEQGVKAGAWAGQTVHLKFVFQKHIEGKLARDS